MNILKERRCQIIMTLGVFFVNYIFDRFTKYLAVGYLKGNGPISFFNNIFVLIYAENTGAFLSLGRNWNIYIKYAVLLIIPIIICIIGLLYLMINEKKNYRIIICSCIIGGGMGNLIDRLFNEFTVIDFMNFGIGYIRTGILNAADLSVTFGVIFLMIFEMKQRSLTCQ
jgi:signal peptidase II